MRTEVQTGVSDGEWIEVTNLQLPTASNGEDPWTPIDGSEQVILGDLSILADGGPVEVAPDDGQGESRPGSSREYPGEAQAAPAEELEPAPPARCCKTRGLIRGTIGATR